MPRSTSTKPMIRNCKASARPNRMSPSATAEIAKAEKPYFPDIDEAVLADWEDQAS